MTTHVAALELRVDARGLVEIAGLTHGEDQAKKLTGELGLEAYEPLNIMSTIIRSGPHGPEALAGIKAKAAERGMRIVEVASLEDLHPKQPALAAGTKDGLSPTSTMAVLHEHTIGPTRKQKMFLPFLFLGILVVLGGLIAIIRDHATRDYGRKGSLAEIVALAGAPPKGGNALAAIFNPDDSRFASVEITSWPFWLGKGAVVESYYMRIPGLRERSIEEMVKGDKGAQPVVLQFDLSRREGTTYRVDAIERGNLPTPNKDLEVTILPVLPAAEPGITLEGGPGIYRDASGVRPDQERELAGLGSFAVQAFVVQRDGGYALRAENFTVAVRGETVSGLLAIMEDLTVTDAAVDALLEGKLNAEQRIELNRRKTTWFLALDEVYPAARRPGPREIGAARIDGVGLRKLYLRNAAA